MEILLEAYRELQEQNIEEKVILTSDIYRNSEINYDRFANYVDFQHFLDCLGYNTGHQPRILANYRSEGKGSSRASDTDSDFSGIHICFSNDLYNEPIVMPKLDCGFIFERDVLEKLALDQG